MDSKARGRSLRTEFILLLLVGGLGVPGLAYGGQVVLDAIEAQSEGGAPGGGTEVFAVIGFAIAPIVGIYILWFGSAVVSHLIANRLYRSREPIKRLFKTSAWAFVPIGLGNLVRTGTLYLAFSDAEIPSNPEGATAGEQIQSQFAATTAEPVALLGTAVLLLSILYSGYLLSFAVQYAKGVSRDEALKTAAVPILVLILYIGQGLI